MALTMTRYRNQETLKKLTALVAEVHGEVALLNSTAVTRHFATDSELQVAVQRRLNLLEVTRRALYGTLTQFDARIDPSRIGLTQKHLKAHGRGRPALARYLAALRATYG